MANGRGNPKGKRDSGRDPGGFVAIPWSVLNSAAYLGLSMHARALLIEVALQYHRDDNGRMLLSRAHLASRGWMSADMLTKAKRELLDAQLIFETVKGQRPNKASWYAITWQRLDRHPGFDQGADKAFQQGAYRELTVPAAPATRGKPGRKNAPLVPSGGTGRTGIVPPHGTETPSPVPPHGPIRAVLTPSPVPPHGHPLDMPSAGVAGVGLESGVQGLSDRRPPETAAAPKGSEIDPDLLGRLSSRLPPSLLEQALRRIPRPPAEGRATGKEKSPC